MTRRRAFPRLVLATSLGIAVLGIAGLGAPGRGAPEAAGDPERGRHLLTEKRCARCHAPRGRAGVGPALETLRRPQGAFELGGRLWNHAPAMFTVLVQEGIEWPPISAAEMADLMAYLQADPARDAAPDLSRGQATLVRKGCLKCHTLRGEGRRIGPDLAERGALYGSAAAWSASMWRHTPRMAAKAIEVGVLYPRFADDEMGNLVGFLRSAVR